jgi:hypothetical protein
MPMYAMDKYEEKQMYMVNMNEEKFMQFLNLSEKVLTNIQQCGLNERGLWILLKLKNEEVETLASLIEEVKLAIQG